MDADLRDLEVPLKLDADGSGQLTAGEVKAPWPAIDARVKSYVQLLGFELPSNSQNVVTRDDAAYASLVYGVACVQAQTQAVAPRSDTPCSKTSMPTTVPQHASSALVR